MKSTLKAPSKFPSSVARNTAGNSRTLASSSSASSSLTESLRSPSALSIVSEALSSSSSRALDGGAAGFSKKSTAGASSLPPASSKTKEQPKLIAVTTLARPSVATKSGAVGNPSGGSGAAASSVKKGGAPALNSSGKATLPVSTKRAYSEGLRKVTASGLGGLVPASLKSVGGGAVKSGASSKGLESSAPAPPTTASLASVSSSTAVLVSAASSEGMTGGDGAVEQTATAPDASLSMKIEKEVAAADADDDFEEDDDEESSDEGDIKTGAQVLRGRQQQQQQQQQLSSHVGRVGREYQQESAYAPPPPSSSSSADSSIAKVDALQLRIKALRAQLASLDEPMTPPPSSIVKARREDAAASSSTSVLMHQFAPLTVSLEHNYDDGSDEDDDNDGKLYAPESSSNASAASTKRLPQEVAFIVPGNGVNEDSVSDQHVVDAGVREEQSATFPRLNLQASLGQRSTNASASSRSGAVNLGNGGAASVTSLVRQSEVLFMPPVDRERQVDGEDDESDLPGHRKVAKVGGDASIAVVSQRNAKKAASSDIPLPHPQPPLESNASSSYSSSSSESRVTESAPPPPFITQNPQLSMKQYLASLKTLEPPPIDKYIKRASAATLETLGGGSGSHHRQPLSEQQAASTTDAISLPPHLVDASDESSPSLMQTFAARSAEARLGSGLPAEAAAVLQSRGAAAPLPPPPSAAHQSGYESLLQVGSDSSGTSTSSSSLSMLQSRLGSSVAQFLVPLIKQAQAAASSASATSGTLSSNPTGSAAPFSPNMSKEQLRVSIRQHLVAALRGRASGAVAATDGGGGAPRQSATASTAHPSSSSAGAAAIFNPYARKKLTSLPSASNRPHDQAQHHLSTGVADKGFGSAAESMENRGAAGTMPADDEKKKRYARAMSHQEELWGKIMQQSSTAAKNAPPTTGSTSALNVLTASSENHDPTITEKAYRSSVAPQATSASSSTAQFPAPTNVMGSGDAHRALPPTHPAGVRAGAAPLRQPQATALVQGGGGSLASTLRSSGNPASVLFAPPTPILVSGSVASDGAAHGQTAAASGDPSIMEATRLLRMDLSSGGGSASQVASANTSAILSEGGMASAMAGVGSVAPSSSIATPLSLPLRSTATASAPTTSASGQALFRGGSDASSYASQLSANDGGASSITGGGSSILDDEEDEEYDEDDDEDDDIPASVIARHQKQTSNQASQQQQQQRLLPRNGHGHESADELLFSYAGGGAEPSSVTEMRALAAAAAASNLEREASNRRLPPSELYRQFSLAISSLDAAEEQHRNFETAQVARVNALREREGLLAAQHIQREQDAAALAAQIDALTFEAQRDIDAKTVLMAKALQGMGQRGGVSSLSPGVQAASSSSRSHLERNSYADDDFEPESSVATAPFATSNTGRSGTHGEGAVLPEPSVAYSSSLPDAHLPMRRGGGGDGGASIVEDDDDAAVVGVGLGEGSIALGDSIMDEEEASAYHYGDAVAVANSSARGKMGAGGRYGTQGASEASPRVSIVDELLGAEKSLQHSAYAEDDDFESASGEVSASPAFSARAGGAPVKSGKGSNSISGQGGGATRGHRPRNASIASSGDLDASDDFSAMAGWGGGAASTAEKMTEEDYLLISAANGGGPASAAAAAAQAASTDLLKRMQLALNARYDQEKQVILLRKKAMKRATAGRVRAIEKLLAGLSTSVPPPPHTSAGDGSKLEQRRLDLRRQKHLAILAYKADTAELRRAMASVESRYRHDMLQCRLDVLGGESAAGKRSSHQTLLLQPSPGSMMSTSSGDSPGFSAAVAPPLVPSGGGSSGGDEAIVNVANRFASIMMQAMQKMMGATGGAGDGSALYATSPSSSSIGTLSNLAMTAAAAVAAANTVHSPAMATSAAPQKAATAIATAAEAASTSPLQMHGSSAFSLDRGGESVISAQYSLESFEEQETSTDAAKRANDFEIDESLEEEEEGARGGAIIRGVVTEEDDDRPMSKIVDYVTERPTAASRPSNSVTENSSSSVRDAGERGAEGIHAPSSAADASGSKRDPLLSRSTLVEGPIPSSVHLVFAAMPPKPSSAAPTQSLVKAISLIESPFPEDELDYVEGAVEAPEKRGIWYSSARSSPRDGPDGSNSSSSSSSEGLLSAVTEVLMTELLASDARIGSARTGQTPPSLTVPATTDSSSATSTFAAASAVLPLSPPSSMLPPGSDAVGSPVFSPLSPTNSSGSLLSPSASSTSAQHSPRAKSALSYSRDDKFMSPISPKAIVGGGGVAMELAAVTPPMSVSPHSAGGAADEDDLYDFAVPPSAMMASASMQLSLLAAAPHRPSASTGLPPSSNSAAVPGGALPDIGSRRMALTAKQQFPPHPSRAEIWTSAVNSFVSILCTGNGAADKAFIFLGLFSPSPSPPPASSAADKQGPHFTDYAESAHSIHGIIDGCLAGMDKTEEGIGALFLRGGEGNLTFPALARDVTLEEISRLRAMNRTAIEVLRSQQKNQQGGALREDVLASFTESTRKLCTHFKANLSKALCGRAFALSACSAAEGPLGPNALSSDADSIIDELANFSLRSSHFLQTLCDSEAAERKVLAAVAEEIMESIVNE